MAYTRIADAIHEVSFTKAQFDEYVLMQKEHKELVEGRLQRQFYASIALAAASTFVGPFLLGPALVIGGQAAVLTALNGFYAYETNSAVGNYKDETKKGYDALLTIQNNWRHSVGLFKNNIVSIKVSVPVMRFKPTLGDVVHVAAGSGVRLLSATTNSGLTFES